MSVLTTAKRSALPATVFAGPDRSYPIPDRAHAANAKARARQMLDAGKLSQNEYEHIARRADVVLAVHKVHDLETGEPPDSEVNGG